MEDGKNRQPGCENDIKKKRPMLDPEEPPTLDKKNRLKLDDDYQEETASELTTQETDDFEKKRQDDEDITNGYGWVAIALSAISFFMVPVLFATAGIVVGFIARSKAAPILGNSAIVTSIISLITHFFIIPMI